MIFTWDFFNYAPELEDVAGFIRATICHTVAITHYRWLEFLTLHSTHIVINMQEASKVGMCCVKISSILHIKVAWKRRPGATWKLVCMTCTWHLMRSTWRWLTPVKECSPKKLFTWNVSTLRALSLKSYFSSSDILAHYVRWSFSLLPSLSSDKDGICCQLTLYRLLLNWGCILEEPSNSFQVIWG